MRSTSRPEAPTTDLRQSTVGLDDIGVALDTVASDLERLWAAAIESGDFSEVTRIVEASHAVHRAALALRADRVIALP